MNRDFKGIWIPRDIWLNKALTMQEKIFYIEIDSLDNEDGCFATNGYFSEFFGISKTRVSLVIKSLIGKGFIKSSIIYKDGTKEILKRVINVHSIPSPIKVKGGIQQKLNTPMQQKLKGINTLDNNTDNTEEVHTPISKSSAPVFDPNKPFEIVAEYSPDKKPDTDYENHVWGNPPQIKPEEFRKLFKKTLGLGDKPGPPKISELKETPLPKNIEVTPKSDSIRRVNTLNPGYVEGDYPQAESKTNAIDESSPQETPNEEKEEEPSIPIVAHKNDELLGTPVFNDGKGGVTEEIPTAEEISKRYAKGFKEMIKTQAQDIYQAYPKKTDKQKALPLIEKAVKAHSYDFIMQKVKEYAYYEKDQEKQYIPSPAVWFRNARWEDELYPRKKPSTTPSHKTEASAKKDSEYGDQLNF